MLALYGAIMIASLTGSLHCAGMCGAFVAFAVGTGGDLERDRRWKLHAAYNSGRLITYTLLGVFAGLVGASLDLAGDLVGIQRAAALLAGGSMVAFGVLAILRINGVRVPKAPVPKPMRDGVQKGFKAVRDKPPVVRALATGLLTTLLPCGWLYAFVIVAAGTADPLLGGLAMASFWLGTLPVLVGLGVGVTGILDRLTGLGHRVPLVAACLVVMVGMFTVLARSMLMIDVPREAVASVPDRDGLMERVRAIEEAEGPSCHDGL